MTDSEKTEKTTALKPTDLTPGDIVWDGQTGHVFLGTDEDGRAIVGEFARVYVTDASLTPAE